MSRASQTKDRINQLDCPSCDTFTFETVTVNYHGEIISRENKTARYYAEDLGNGISMEMVAIPEGKFLMGSAENDKYSRDSERPQHKVTVPPFFMGKYLITQAQWREIASRTDLKVERDLEPNPAYFQDRLDSDNRPVERVSWEDAMEFCARVSKLTGRNYRLPSEAEWEYACRAGTTTPFYFGEKMTPELANYNTTETSPVGQFPPNSFGLYDMHGNVWEWCLDTWHDNYEGAPCDGSAWIEGENNCKVVRGGSWYYYPQGCRSAGRFWVRHDDYAQDGGFRVVCVSGSTL